MLIYVAHPYGGDEKNKKKVEEIIKRLYREHSTLEYTLISPINAFGYLYNVMTYEEGIRLCFELLLKCDSMVLCDGWEESKGCIMEKEWAEKYKIPVDYIKDFMVED